MKKTILATLTILAPLMFAQAAFANDKQVEVTASLPTATSPSITKSDILDTTQDYLVAQTDILQPYRSALFAHILDVAAQRATLAAAAASSALSGS
jgi:hypothetical protein